jgi:hypothetical protein
MKLTQFFSNLFKSSKKEIIIDQPQVKPKTFKAVRGKNLKSKRRQVLFHLIREGKIDSWTAINLYGATRLSAIIFDLRQEGYNIESISNSSFDRNNEVCNFTTYKYIIQ